jgi:two-component system, NtrC family, response regulator AtoC
VRPFEAHKIVLLETDKSRRDTLKAMVFNWGCRPFVFENESICLDNLDLLDPDLVLTGTLDTERALRFINSLKVIRSDLPVLFLSGDERVRDYIDFNGFCDVMVLWKSTSPVDIKSAVLAALDPAEKNGSNRSGPLIIGNSPAIAKIKRQISKINQANEPVLIEGEPGTGKELFARAIHGHSDRRDHPFIMVNALKLPYQLLEGELFGHQARLGSNFPRHKNGVFAVAEKCTFFIKQIEAIPQWLQARLLELIEGGARLTDGGAAHKAADVRIIASTTHAVDNLAAQGVLRKDFYYRLNVLNLKVPPLRQRVVDIPPLVDYFSWKHGFELNRGECRMSPETKAWLCEYSWPGNVQELETFVSRVALIGDDPDVLQRFFPEILQPSGKEVGLFRLIEGLPSLSEIRGVIGTAGNYGLKSIRAKCVCAIDQNLVAKVLHQTNWNRKKAARLLGISYKSLLNKIKAYDLSPTRQPLTAPSR